MIIRRVPDLPEFSNIQQENSNDYVEITRSIDSGYKSYKIGMDNFMKFIKDYVIAKLKSSTSYSCEGLPIGSIFYSSTININDNITIANGSLFTSNTQKYYNVSYLPGLEPIISLLGVMVDNGNTNVIMASVDEFENYNLQKYNGKWLYDKRKNIFRVPNIVNSSINITTNIKTIGDYTEQGMPVIKGDFDIFSNSLNGETKSSILSSYADNVFQIQDEEQSVENYEESLVDLGKKTEKYYWQSLNSQKIYIDASSRCSTFNDNDTINPDTVKYVPYVVLKQDFTFKVNQYGN